MRADILLPTWNGARYLPAQLQSLLAQTHENFRVLVRDDGSTDGTVKLLEEAAAKDPRVVLLRDDRGRLGAAGNVNALLQHSDAPYTLLCDQDDVWLSNKVSLELAAMAELEKLHGADVPLLVFSDLEVVDEELREVSGSFWRFRSLDPDRGITFPRLMVRNLIVGCTMAMNAPLRRALLPVPAEAYMHDWWIALVASALGKMRALHVPLVRYRQHGKNTIGAGRSLASDAAAMLRDPKRLRRYYDRTQLQAKTFVERFRPLLTPGDLRAAELYAKGGWSPLRPAQLWSAGVRDSNLLRNLSLLALG